jgi:hypothetical protein
VSVPLDHDVRLRVDSSAVSNLIWLADLEPDDLYSLILDRVTMSPEDIKYLTRLSGIRELSLRDTPADGDTLHGLHGLQGLTKLDLAGTQVKGVDMLQIVKFGDLRSLDVSRTPLTGDGLLHLTQLNWLEELIIADTKIADGATVHVRHLTALRSIDVRGTSVTGHGRRRIPSHVLVHADE